MESQPQPGQRRVTRQSRQPRTKPRASPYFGLDQNAWAAKTLELIEHHPANLDDLVAVVLSSWASIFQSSLGSGFRIGTHIFPRPQILGFLLHELVPLEFEHRFPGLWRRDASADEKDLVYVTNDSMSVELKTSSSSNQIFANRSYGQQNHTRVKKDKSGYYLAVNFERWDDADGLPSIRLIRFGWLDHSDWHSQEEASGQQASLPPIVENLQLLTVYEERRSI
ncbi:ScaI family restriction endonuclease [Candidatus Poriferisodalis sp.]|uniref:ScaI family restriction endonuclease n=1 Tax=Candidatus Poriferisodalis sp. TaxID=3101277 RepID=UPI003B02745A